MRKFSRALIKGSFNPLHKGHLCVLEIAKEYADKTDIYIGNRKRRPLIPREIRTKAMEENIAQNEWEKYFNIISTGRHKELDLSKYDLYITGSDLLNLVAMRTSSRGRFVPQEFKNWFLSFPNTLSIQRIGGALTPEAKAILKRNTNLLYESCSIDESSSKIRKAYGERKDISTMLSNPTWEIIKDYIHIWKN